MANRRHQFNLSLGDEAWRILEKMKTETTWPKNKIIGRALRVFAYQRLTEQDAATKRKVRIDKWLEEEPEAGR
jgi:hypothetical protein